MSERPEQARRASSLATLGWAVYLGVSWTWCIGMFLPVLLIRDFGAAGFWVFAIPNVLGAAAMGWVLSHAGSARICDQHGAMVRCFSLVTAAFQLSFATLMVLAVRPLNAGISLGDAALLGAAASWAALVWVMHGRLQQTGRREESGAIGLLIAGAVWAVSAGLFAWLWSRGSVDLRAIVPTPGQPPAGSSASGELPALDLAFLAPVCLLGFLLCPYLDGTFHRARRALANDEDSKAAFTLGFGGLFLTMILFTGAYAPLLIGSQTREGLFAWTAGAAAWGLAVHLGVQLAFTFAAHGAEWRDGAGGMAQTTAGGRRRWPLVALIAVSIGLPVAMTAMPSITGSLGNPEVLYRGYMAFYGLVFPAYVLLCLVPLRGQTQPTSGRVSWWVVTVAAATPFYWLGFIERQTWWLGPGVGVVLVAWGAQRMLTARASRAG